MPIPKKVELIRKAWALSGFVQVEINWGEELVEISDKSDKRMEISFTDARELAAVIMSELGEPDNDKE